MYHSNYAAIKESQFGIPLEHRLTDITLQNNKWIKEQPFAKVQHCNLFLWQ